MQVFVAYSAANIFMDAYVDKRSQTRPANWISVNWDGWKLWEEGRALGDLHCLFLYLDVLRDNSSA